MQERAYIVQTPPVRDTSRCEQPPATWSASYTCMGKHFTERHRWSSWSMEKAITCKHVAKGHHCKHLL